MCKLSTEDANGSEFVAGPLSLWAELLGFLTAEKYVEPIRKVSSSKKPTETMSLEVE